MARCAWLSGSPCTRIETWVPSSGRARSIWSDDDRIGGQEAFDAVGDVAARKRGAGNILDVLGESQGCTMALAGELLPPGPVSNLTAVGFAIFQNLNRFDGAA